MLVFQDPPGAPLRGAAIDQAAARDLRAVTRPPPATNNSRRPMATVIRPSRARCVKERYHTKSVRSSHSRGAACWLLHLCRVKQTLGLRLSINRQRGLAVLFDHLIVATPRASPNGRLWNVQAGSLRLNARELDHFGPLLGFVSDELSEFGRRH